MPHACLRQAGILQFFNYLTGFPFEIQDKRCLKQRHLLYCPPQFFHPLARGMGKVLSGASQG
jgi:hypothetical protein